MLVQEITIFVHNDYLTSMLFFLPSVHVASSDTVLSYNFPLKRNKKMYESKYTTGWVLYLYIYSINEKWGKQNVWNT